MLSSHAKQNLPFWTLSYRRLGRARPLSMRFISDPFGPLSARRRLWRWCPTDKTPKHRSKGWNKRTRGFEIHESRVGNLCSCETRVYVATRLLTNLIARSLMFVRDATSGSSRTSSTQSSHMKEYQPFLFFFLDAYFRRMWKALCQLVQHRNQVTLFYVHAFFNEFQKFYIVLRATK